jgi:hypothetical protein
VLGLDLPPPIDLITATVLSTLEPHTLEIVFKRLVGLGLGKNRQVDNDVDVCRAGVGRDLRRTGLNDVARYEPADQEH